MMRHVSRDTRIRNALGFLRQILFNKVLAAQLYQFKYRFKLAVIIIWVGDFFVA
jgi:hypothetical protein